MHSAKSALGKCLAKSCSSWSDRPFFLGWFSSCFFIDLNQQNYYFIIEMNTSINNKHFFFCKVLKLSCYPIFVERQHVLRNTETFIEYKHLDKLLWLGLLFGYRFYVLSDGEFELLSLLYEPLWFEPPLLKHVFCIIHCYYLLTAYVVLFFTNCVIREHSPDQRWFSLHTPAYMLVCIPSTYKYSPHKLEENIAVSPRHPSYDY